MPHVGEEETRSLPARVRSLFAPPGSPLPETAVRSKRRYRRIAYGAGTGAMARGVGIVVSLFMVPLALGYLGPDRYGMWLTMTSVIGLLGFTDLGIGNGLVNALAEADGRGDRAAANRYISSAVAALALIAIVVALIFAALYPRVDWAGLFNVESREAVAEAGPTVAILTACFLISLPLGLVTRVRGALQEGFIDSIWAIAGTVLSLLAVIAFIVAGQSLPWLALGVAGFPLVALAVNGSSLLYREHPWIRITPSGVTRDAMRRVMGVGLYFFALQTAAAIAYQSDTIIIARILGSATVPQYAIPAKLFLVIPMMMSFVVLPIWPAYREALSRGDHDWIRVAFKRSFLLSLAVSVPAALVLTLVSRPLIHVWVGADIDAAPLLTIGLGAWVIVASLGGAASTFLNALGVLRPQAICAVFMALANIVLSIWLTGRIGVSGVVYGSLIAQFSFVALPVLYLVRRELGRLDSAPKPGEVVG